MTVSTLYPPLHYPPGFPRPQSLLDQLVPKYWWLSLVPAVVLAYWSVTLALAVVVLWFIVVQVCMDPSQSRRADRFVEEQLTQRDVIPDSAWGDDPRRAAVAHRMIEQIQGAIDWKQPHFIPQDSFGIAICWQTGDLCEVDAMFRIEKEFGLPRSKQGFIGVPRDEMMGVTMGDIVDRLMAMSPKINTA